MAQTNPAPPSYLLDSDLQTDSPIPVFKPFTQVLLENLPVLAVLLLVIFLCFAFWFWRKRKKPSENFVALAPRIDPYQEAQDALSSLQKEKPKLEPKPFIFRLSQILRLYIEREFRLTALEQTSEEFIDAVGRHSFLKLHALQPVQEFASRGDLIKYSPEYNLSKDLEELFNLAQHIVEHTHAELQKKKLQEEANQSQTQAK